MHPKLEISMWVYSRLDPHWKSACGSIAAAPEKLLAEESTTYAQETGIYSPHGGVEEAGKRHQSRRLDEKRSQGFFCLG
jgi:hypothetical protein